MTNEQPIEPFKATAEVTADYADRILIPDVGCVDSRPTLELAKAGDEIGVDGITAVPPFCYKHSEDLVMIELGSKEPFSP